MPRNTKGRKGKLEARFVSAAIFSAVILLSGLAAACSSGGGGDEGGFDAGPVIVNSDAKITPIIVSSEITTGDDRISVGLLDEQQQPIADAQLRFNFYSVANNQGTLFAETEATPIKVTQSYTDTHTDGTIETHEVGEIGVYVGHVDFKEAGDYGLRIVGKVKGADIEPLQIRFNVLGETPSIGVGELAPKTVQPILSDVEDITAIDTSDPADPDMHDQTIADAVSSGRPTVIVFATPSFCTSRICGPVKQTVDRVAEKYKDQANFVHVEPFDLAKARSGQGLEPLPFLEGEWGLTTEPWVFVVDKDGIVSARFEAAVSADEIEKALQAAISTPKTP